MNGTWLEQWKQGSKQTSFGAYTAYTAEHMHEWWEMGNQIHPRRIASANRYRIPRGYWLIVNIPDDKCLFLNGLTIIFNRTSVQRNNSFLFLPLLEWVWLQRENQELASRSLEHCIHFIEDICACSVILVDYYILDGGQDDYYGCEFFLLHFPLLSI
jgi:hypothetical protein